MVMLATFTIEVGAALYTLFKYRMTRTAQLITAILSFLAVFQFAEYMVCQGAFMLSSLEWARLGYAAISILPPLGLHLGLQIAKKKNTPLLVAAYGSAAAFTMFFLFVGQGMHAQQCLGNYVLFHIAPYALLPYFFYYYGWLILTIHMAWMARAHVKDAKTKLALAWLVIGYLSFMVPTLIVNMIDQSTIQGIPSIMCGFAILWALALLFKVAPLVLKENQPAKESARASTK